MKRFRIALLTYSTKPRGGVTHTINLAESLARLGHDVHVYALSTGKGFPSEVAFPHTLIQCPVKEYRGIDDKITDYIDTYTSYLAAGGLDYDILHAEDCISANALLNLREKGLIDSYVRTVHHVDDFTSTCLIECQDKSLREPDYLIAVSEHWKRELEAKYSLDSVVINNGVDYGTYSSARGGDKEAAKKEFGAGGAKVMLSIGGIEPRKNTITVLHAYNAARAYLKTQGERLVWLIGGGETLFDYRAYRHEFFSELSRLGLGENSDVIVLGSVPAGKMPLLYASADVFAFPSVKEGWGLVLLEAMSGGVPVVSSNIPPMTEFLTNGENAVLVDPADYKGLARGILEIVEDPELAARLAAKGDETARFYSWESAARRHAELYGSILEERSGKNIKRAGSHA
ncbi:MAG TPA: MSMEG_0565 family glycosyltransferase [Thermodesulfobacteriota bacterium]|nr:MSMEG_0565 family glycosyltransferase [Thermodesulfobacteriota bacterium]